MIAIEDIDPTAPVLIAGPTASGKSGLALAIARAQGGIVINADALQVFANWRVLTARPSAQEESQAPHALYGHVVGKDAYSVGQWLRDLDPFFNAGPRPIIVGGTGLYFTALTEGLAAIPEIPPAIRAEGDTLPLEALLEALDDTTRGRIDVLNRARVQRAWEVQRATGRGLAEWQDNTPPPRLPLSECTPLLIDAPKAWLTPRIEQRFDAMLEMGALDEVASNQAHWDPTLPSMRAIGAPELMAHLNGETTLATARTAAIIATRQYAKRQRTWFRKRMAAWRLISAD